MSSSRGEYGTQGEAGEYGSSMGTAVESSVRRLKPHLLEHSRSGTLTGVTGAFSILRAFRTYRRGKRGRALLQLAFGLVWIGVAVTQRRERRDRTDGVDQTDVASPTTDFGAVDTDDERGVDHHEDVGDVDAGTDMEDVDDVETDERANAGEGGVDQREVADTGTDVDAADDDGDEADVGGDVGTADEERTVEE